jgi:hypothetical protein
MKYIYPVIIACFFVCSCKTNLVYIHTTDPAPVSLARSAKHAAIINRSVPSDENRAATNVHQANNGQTINLVKEASAECLKGLNNSLIENKRFDLVKILDKPDLRTTVAGTFPSALGWKEVETIC